MTTRPLNRLAAEKSPYLLQHATNPVDWYPWGDEAFTKARTEDKLVFLSIGYATCHWCHVMERESFEDEATAAVVNECCVPVKVDREERPDLDQVYMSVCQALTGSGGWPLNVLLTPEGVPVFAGTYFPPQSRAGRIGLRDLLRRAAALWKEQPDGLRAAGSEVLERLEAGRKTAASALDPNALQQAVDLLAAQFDEARGGFGRAPKFPMPHNLVFLLRRYRRGDRDALRMVEKTLDELARGGIFDHLGSGFHRYATDPSWLLPHFEKMLYDEAGLALAYLEAYAATGDARWSAVARQALDYVLRDLASPEGGFCSAEDADSEGVEGRFYVWTHAEILSVLGPEEGDLASRFFGVLPEGNYAEEASGHRTGENVLHLPRSVASWAAERGEPEAELAARVETWREALLARRSHRIRPARDDKVVTAWNGYAVSAFARAYALLSDPEHLAAAEKAADFLWTALRPEGRLLRRYRDGEAAIHGFAEDYAYLARGFLDLYAATFEPRRLSQAAQLARELVALFWDEASGGLFDSPADADPLVLRPREVYDGAFPSANSVALELFARLWLLTGETSWEERARGTLEAFAKRVSDYPAAYCQFLQGAAFLLEPTRELVVAGDPGASETEMLLEAVRRTWSPETTVLFVPAGAAEDIAALAPFAAALRPQGTAAAFPCRAGACGLPITDPEALKAELEKPPA